MSTMHAAPVRRDLAAVNEAIRYARGVLPVTPAPELERKDNHPLAQADELLDVLAEIEARGLLEAELCVRLTAEARARLAELDDPDGRAER
jgi:hypothetical protein